MSTKTFTVHNDPGHGWVAVKRDYLNALDIFGEISSFSFQRGATVYLEEDCDAATFIKAHTALTGEAPKWDSRHSNGVSPIRSYDQFNKDIDPRIAAQAFKGIGIGDTVTLAHGYTFETATITGFNHKGKPIGTPPGFDYGYVLSPKNVIAVTKAS